MYTPQYSNHIQTFLKLGRITLNMHADFFFFFANISSMAQHSNYLQDIVLHTNDTLYHHIPIFYRYMLSK